ncbi:Acidic mammalian chitinase [Plecturocebus cupreus]
MTPIPEEEAEEAGMNAGLVHGSHQCNDLQPKGLLGGLHRRGQTPFAGPKDQGDGKYFNVDYAMNYWKSQGAAAEKLMVGFSAYIHTFTLTNPAKRGLHAPTSGPGTAGPALCTGGWDPCLL